jgi:hypothetical protein
VVLVAVALVVVLGVGAVVVLSLRRNRARPVSISDAQRRLPGTTAPGVAAGRPAPGVYEYRGSGTERLSLPPLSQKEGPTIPGSVVWQEAAGCWQFRLDFSTNHWQDWTYCRHGNDVEERGGSSWQRWMIGPQAFTNLTTSRCDPGTMVVPSPRTAGQEWSQRCAGTSDQVKGVGVSAGPYRFVADEDLEVGGTTVRAAHFVRTRTMTGAQQGSERSDVWFAADTGLPLRNRRSIRAKTDTVVGSSTYTEVGHFELVSLHPRTQGGVGL